MAEPIHHTSARTYVASYAGLLVMTGLTLFLSLRPIGLPEMGVALTIASAKAIVVALFFMHLVEQRFSVRLIAVVAVLFVVILVTFVVADIATRRTFPRAPSPALVDEVEP